ncbi:MAG: PadR family transcriptional regulator [Candidatus Eisenbacteria bacterium]|nr:PadR family transcriptional regulator [Candidatus Eisenbacteria bacterium]
MARTNKTRYAVLGLLSSGPKSGYDIRRESEHGIGHFWHETYGAIYPMLRRLEEEGLIQGESGGHGRRPRRVYPITPRGLDALRAWLAAPPERSRVRDELLLKAYFGREARDALLRHVQRCKVESLARLAELDGIRRRLEQCCSSHPDQPFWLITVSMGVHRARTCASWCDETLQRIRRLDAPEVFTVEEHTTTGPEAVT